MRVIIKKCARGLDSPEVDLKQVAYLAGDGRTCRRRNGKGGGEGKAASTGRKSR